MKLRQQIKHLKKRAEKLEAERDYDTKRIDSLVADQLFLEKELNEIKGSLQVAETPSEKRTWFGLRKA